MRRAAATVALLVVVAAPALAQKAVHGGPSFRNAAVVEPGRHRDTIRPGETLFYAVDVPEGSMFSVSAVARGRDRVAPLETRLRLYNAERVEDPFAGDAGFLRAPGSLRLRSRSGRVGPPNPDYPEAGTQYFSVSVVAPRGRLAAEFDLLLGVATKQVRPPEPLPVKEDPVVDRLPEPSRTGTYALALLAGTIAGGFAAFLLSKVRQPPTGLRHRL